MGSEILSLTGHALCPLTASVILWEMGTEQNGRWKGSEPLLKACPLPGTGQGSPDTSRVIPIANLQGWDGDSHSSCGNWGLEREVG